ncbi:MAG: family transcriptional regulator, cyclic receptor protein [Thermoleophilaceae bacterium]|jgi:CRP-like cAMP-binding protein|nr:family transcriptional regulator, cyclic receptor protein [Thermoleophilaceae bacterium]
MDKGRLKALPLFANVSDENLASVAPFVKEVSVAEGAELVREGDYSYELIAIEEGTADVIKDGQKIASLGPGDYFGEMGVVEGQKRTATVVATSPMRLVSLTSWEIRRMQKSMPEAVESIRETIEERRPH